MGRPAKKLHELTAVRKGRKAVVNYRGGQVYLGTWDAKKNEPSPAAARRLAELLALWRADPAATARSRADDPPLAEVWAEWRLSPDGRRRNRDLVARVARNLFGTAEEPGPHRGTIATEFGSPELSGWQSYLCELRHPPKKDGTPGDKRLCRHSIINCVQMVRIMMGWAVVQKIIPYDQLRELELVPKPADGEAKPDRKRRGVLREQVDAARPHLSAPMWALLDLMWWTCTRPSELLRLRCGDIRKGGVVQAVSGVRLDLKKLGVWAAVLEEHKKDGTAYDRVIFFGPKSQRILARLLKGQPATAALLRPEEAVPHPNARYGEFFCESAAHQATRRACKAMGVPRWTPYQIRHAVFVEVQARWGRDAARVFGGHQVGGVTENYAGADLMTAAKVAKKWG